MDLPFRIESEAGGIRVVFPHSSYGISSEERHFVSAYLQCLPLTLFGECSIEAGAALDRITWEEIKAEIVVQRLQKEFLLQSVGEHQAPIDRDFFKRDNRLMMIAYRIVSRHIPNNTSVAVAVTAKILGIPVVQMDSARRSDEAYHRLFE